MSIKGKAYLAGIYEHPTRHAPDKSTAQLHAEVAKGALEDAGLTKADIDGYFCAGDAPGGVMAMADYLGLKVRHFDSTDTGGCSYLVHLGHAAEAIAVGKCSIALITLAGKPRTGAMPPRATGAEVDFEAAYGATTHNIYGMCAMRHMHEFGTTSEQLAWIKVAASHHAQYNEHAMLRDVVTVEDVINSPMISDPLHRMDCCVVTDGGGALIVTNEAIAQQPEEALSAHDRARRSAEGTARRQGPGSDLFRRRVVWTARVRRGRRDAQRHQIRLDLRQFHHHGTDAARGPRLLREGRGRQVRRRRQSDFRRRQVAVQHRWRRPLQQSSRQPRRHDKNHRSGASAARASRTPRCRCRNCDLAIAHGTGGLLGVRHAASTCILERV